MVKKELFQDTLPSHYRFTLDRYPRCVHIDEFGNGFATFDYLVDTTRIKMWEGRWGCLCTAFSSYAQSSKDFYIKVDGLVGDAENVYFYDTQNGIQSMKWSEVKDEGLGSATIKEFSNEVADKLFQHDNVFYAYDWDNDCYTQINYSGTTLGKIQLSSGRFGTFSSTVLSNGVIVVPDRSPATLELRYNGKKKVLTTYVDSNGVEQPLPAFHGAAHSSPVILLDSLLFHVDTTFEIVQLPPVITHPWLTVSPSAFDYILEDNYGIYANEESLFESYGSKLLYSYIIASLGVLPQSNTYARISKAQDSIHVLVGATLHSGRYMQNRR